MVAKSPKATRYIEVLQAMSLPPSPAPIATGWSDSCRAGFAPAVGQRRQGAQENEISAIPRLLKRLELNGALVTIDAMGCQHGIAETILSQGADYLLALKGNQKSLHAEVAMFFHDTAGLDTHQTTDADHGRVETRRAWVSHDVAWLHGDRAEPGLHRFPQLACIGTVEAEVEHKGKTTTARRYFLSSTPLSAAQLLRAARAHWGIENRLHWVMDVVYHDDLMRLRTSHGPANMAIMRHTAMNIFKATKGKASLKVKRKSAAWDDEYLFSLIPG